MPKKTATKEIVQKDEPKDTGCTLTPSNRSIFVERLRALVGGGSVRGFAATVGTSPNAMRTYLAGTSEPTLGVLQKIATATGVTVSWLIGEADEPGEALPPVEMAGLAERLRLAWPKGLPELMQRSGVSMDDLRGYMLDGQPPSEDAVRRIAKAAGVSPAWLAAGIGRRQIIEAPDDLGVIAHNIKELIKDKGGVQPFAGVIGVSPHHVQELVSGAACPSFDLLPVMARACGRSLNWLLTGEEDAPRAAPAGKPDDRDAFDPELLRAVVRAMQQYEEDYGKTIKAADRPDLTAMLYQVASRLADRSEHAVARTVIDILQRAA